MPCHFCVVACFLIYLLLVNILVIIMLGMRIIGVTFAGLFSFNFSLRFALAASGAVAAVASFIKLHFDGLVCVYLIVTA